MQYVTYNRKTGEILGCYSRPDTDPIDPVNVETADIGFLLCENPSHDYYVHMGALIQKPEKPEGIAKFNYITKQWDVDTLETVRDRRAGDYPPIGDQLDALWKIIKANESKIDLMEAQSVFDAIQEVKTKYPKEI